MTVMCGAYLPGSGALVWEVNVNSFPFGLKAADVDRDGRAEVFAAAADGGLYAINSKGGVEWVFRSKTALYNVDTGNIIKGGNSEIVCGGIDRRVYVLSSRGDVLAVSDEFRKLVHRLKTGDLDGDGTDEIFAVDARTEAMMLKLSGGSLRTVWAKTMKVPDEFINWENPRGNFFAFSLDIADLDGDGRQEVIAGDTYFNKQSVLVMNSEAEPLWISKKQQWRHIGDTFTEFYSTAFVTVADIDAGHEGKEVLAVKGGIVEVFSKDGVSLGKASSRLGFTDIIVDGTIMYLGSTPNGDNTVYRIDMSGDWVKTIENLERHGRAKEVGDNLNLLRERVLMYSGTPDYSGRIYNIRFGGIRRDDAGYTAYRESVDWFRKEFPYDNLRRVVSMRAIEPEPPLDENGEPWSENRWKVDALNGTMTVDEIINTARWIEEHRVPAIFSIGHSCMPFITLETAEKILKAAPEYCAGFISLEDEQLERIPRYFKYYFGPLADLCARYGGKQCITLNKNVWYASVPSIGKVYNELFAGERKKVLLPATEDSNSRTPEINLLGRGGLWLAGLVKGFQVSIISDLFSFCRFHQWEYPKSGHPYLRLLVAHTLLGGSDFMSRIMDIKRENGSYAFSTLGKESVEIFYHMLGKGLIFTPRREDALGFSPVGLAVHEPPEKWLRDGHNGHRPEMWKDDPELRNAVIPHGGCLWGNTETPEHALQRVLLKKKRQFGYNIPATPYGLVAMVPAHADLKNVPHIKEWWHTDGIYIWREGGEKMTGTEAANALRSSFEEAAAGMPFRVSGGDAFMQAVRIKPGTYRLFIVDPGWLDPCSRNVSIRIQKEGTFSARDVLTGQSVPVDDKKIDAVVPAGSFLIYDVTSS